MNPASMIATIAPNTRRSLCGILRGTIRWIFPIATGAAVLLLGATASARSAFEVVGNDAPAWSPDGTQIAFTSFRNGKGDIYVMHPDGSDQTRLTTSGAHDDLAAWSPDSKRIAFASDRSGQLELWVMNRDGTDQRQLTHDNARDYAPTWSPDGKRLAFRSDRDGNAEIYAMDADGTHERRLTFSSASDNSPRWGLDGRIVFVTNRENGSKTSLWVMNGDGSDQHRLTPSSFFWNESRPVWSPDDLRIIFQADRDGPVGNTELYSMATDGTDLRRLTTYPGKDDWPTWSPDGKQIAFARGPSPFANEVYLMNADGTDTHEITLPKLAGLQFGVFPSPPRAGKVFRVIYDVSEVSGADRVSPTVACAARLGAKAMRERTRTFDDYSGRASCAWLLPKTAKGKRLTATIAVSGPMGTISRRFSARVR
jgi:dipeptidyl aminopeptidase/acylaminoacyl peptidase